MNVHAMGVDVENVFNSPFVDCVVLSYVSLVGFVDASSVNLG